MLAVKLAYRSLGLGYQLKLAQRERALAKSIDRITWTFDPLQAVNAHFNFEKLGVVAYQYKTSFYGETSSFLHRTGTDRLWVTWLLNSERVKRRIELSSASASRPGKPEHVTALIQIDKDREPLIGDDEALDHTVFIEIPADFNRVAEERIELATRWREATRKAFTQAINAGYFVEEFYFEEKSGQKIGVYLLTQQPQLSTSE
jgi:predicted GNAT superfamily acetyltransferase